MGTCSPETGNYAALENQQVNVLPRKRFEIQERNFISVLFVHLFLPSDSPTSIFRLTDCFGQWLSAPAPSPWLCKQKIVLFLQILNILFFQSFFFQSVSLTLILDFNPSVCPSS